MSGIERKDDGEKLVAREESKAKERFDQYPLPKEYSKDSPSPLYSDSPLLSESRESELTLEEVKEAQQLLRHVVYGEQDEAEILAKKNPKLLLFKGDITDLSKREFKSITPFQYAFWALDWHMWMMLLKYMEQEDAALQWKELDTEGTPYGIHANWQNLINAYAEYDAFVKTGSFEAAGITWRERVGKEQLLVPVHVANEFCHDTRSLSSFRYFKDYKEEPKLTRNRISQGLDWYNKGCGKEWAHYRGSLKKVNRIKLNSSMRFAELEQDGPLLSLLLEKRQKQADDLAKTLKLVPNQPQIKS